MKHNELFFKFKKIKLFNISTATNFLGKSNYNSLPDYVKEFVTEKSFSLTCQSMKNFIHGAFFCQTFSERLMIYSIPNLLEKNKFQDIIDHFNQFKSELEIIDNQWSKHLVDVHFFGFFNYILDNESQHSKYFLNSINSNKKEFILKYTKNYLLYFENKDHKINEKIINFFNEAGITYDQQLIKSRNNNIKTFFFSNLNKYFEEENIQTHESIWIKTFIEKNQNNNISEHDIIVSL